jgi:hypothetical protein
MAVLADDDVVVHDDAECEAALAVAVDSPLALAAAAHLAGSYERHAARPSFKSTNPPRRAGPSRISANFVALYPDRR